MILMIGNGDGSGISLGRSPFFVRSCVGKIVLFLGQCCTVLYWQHCNDYKFEQARFWSFYVMFGSGYICFFFKQQWYIFVVGGNGVINLNIKFQCLKLRNKV